jgi:hypothetical protein
VDLGGILRTTVRHWYLLLPVLLIAGVYGWFAGRTAPPSYTATGVLVVSAPYAGDDIAREHIRTNGYFALSNTSYLLWAYADSDDVRIQIARRGGDQQYTVDTDDLGNPILTVRVIGQQDEQRALTTFRMLDQLLVDKLSALQADKQVPSEYRVDLVDVRHPQQADVYSVSRNKVFGAMLLLGLVLGVGLCLHWDRRWSKRARLARRAAAHGRHPTDDAGQPAGVTPSRDPVGTVPGGASGSSSAAR